jgi:HPt (histidine-containing phosphotransfer) domain-containing protein
MQQHDGGAFGPHTAFGADDLLAAVEGEHETAQAIAAGFVAMRESLVDKMAAALAAGDFGAAQDVAHEIKGMAGTLGARRLAAIAAALEAEARSRSATAAQTPLLEVLRREWQAVAGVLERFSRAC